MPLPSPLEHPNATATVASGSVTAFIVTEAKRRFGVDITVAEAGMIVTAISAGVLFLAGKKHNAQTRDASGQFVKAPK